MNTLLQINVTANSGSHGKIAEDIGNIVIDNGWKSVIAYGQRANPSKSDLIRIGSDFDIREHGLETRFLDNHGLSSRNATKCFLRQVNDIKPSVIHLHNIHGYYINYQLLFQYLKEKNIPIVWTLHDCWTFTGHCAYFDYAGCDKWKDGCKSPCPCKHNYPKSFLMDSSEKNYLLKKSSFQLLNKLAIVPVSYWLGDLVKQSFLGEYPIKVIQNGIDINVFRPRNELDYLKKNYNLCDKRVILGVANIWEERKGLRDFIKLRNLISQQYVIVLVGVSPKQKKTLSEGILGICRTQNQDELAQIYSCADIFLNLTYEDNYPTTNLEAMACGTPVLTYKTGGSSESISPETGWVLDQGDVVGVAEIIKKVVNENNEIQKERRIACRQRAEDSFDKNKKFKEYLELYESFISG